MSALNILRVHSLFLGVVLLIGCEVDLEAERESFGEDVSVPDLPSEVDDGSGQESPNDDALVPDDEVAPDDALVPDDEVAPPDSGEDGSSEMCDYTAEAIQGMLDLPATPHDYAGQRIPEYIRKDNTGQNIISNEGATLGRVLFYDTHLSSTDSVACASCHQQEAAFSDRDRQSMGVSGVTGRHSMRLINARFASEAKFFWDERADTLEAQTTQPIRDSIEMGYSGENGDPSFADLIDKLTQTPYYPMLFLCAFGDSAITESRMQAALAQFVRSIQSFDSKYDQGRSMVMREQMDFPNFTVQENQGKQLYLERPIFDGQGFRTGGGLGCQGCHRAPEFDIDPDSGNNGLILEIDNTTDTGITRSPSLRDIFDRDGVLNGDLMHSGIQGGLDAVLDHYDRGIGDGEAIPRGIDRRLLIAGRSPQRLNLSATERAALIAFMRTLSGQDVYTNVIWSNPFR